MEVKVLEQTEEKIKIEMDDKTFINLLNTNLWKQKIDYAAWTQAHPYLAKPTLLVKSKNPKQSLLDAADQIIEDITALKKALAKAKK
jgi:DNA-directed RNA polymerase subunit L